MRAALPLRYAGLKRGVIVPLVALASLAAASGQPLTVEEKAEVHARRMIAPVTWAGIVASAGYQQWRGNPEQWGGGMEGYGRRAASSAGRMVLRESFGFALNAALRTDPRRPRSGGGSFKHRLRHALIYTVAARTDAGRPTFNVARVGGRIGSELLANSWMPPGHDETRDAFRRAAVGMGLLAVKNVAAEFLPGIKNKIFRRRGSPAHSTAPAPGAAPAPPAHPAH